MWFFYNFFSHQMLLKTLWICFIWFKNSDLNNAYFDDFFSPLKPTRPAEALELDVGDEYCFWGGFFNVLREKQSIK